MSEREAMTAENVGAIADNYEAMAWDFVRQTGPDNQLGVTEKHEIALLRAWADALDAGGVYDHPQPAGEAERTESCHRCGARYWPVIWHTSDEMWARVAGTFNHDDGGGLLCVPCFSALARDRGLMLVWTPALETSRDHPQPAETGDPK